VGIFLLIVNLEIKMTKEIEKHNELLALYKQTLSEINDNKTLPWKINIANAILAGFLIMVIVHIRMNNCLECFTPFIFAVLIAYLTFVFFTCYVAGSCFDKVVKSKIILSKLYNKFSNDFNNMLDDKRPDKLEFGELISLATSIAFPLFLLALLVLLCVI
jgi:hypothetical protein